MIDIKAIETATDFYSTAKKEKNEIFINNHSSTSILVYNFECI
jgi:hypothetical protein